MRAPAALLLAVFMLLAGGCSSLQTASVRMMRDAVAGPPGVDDARVLDSALPYAQIRLDSPFGVRRLVLGSADGDRLRWYGPDGDQYLFEHGLLRQTVGLPVNLDASRWLTTDPLAAGLGAITAPTTLQLTVDLSPGYRYGVQVNLTLQPAGEETLTILGQTHRVKRIDATVNAPGLGWHATDRFWVGVADGRVWKSTQTLPGGATYTFTVLRPFEGAAP